MSRQQLPPQIRKIYLPGGALRYELRVDTGIVNGKRKQIMRRFKTEREARNELATTLAAVVDGSYVHANKLTVDAAIDAWLASKHSIKASTRNGYKVWLAPVRGVLGHVELQQLTKAHLDTLIVRLRAGDVPGHGKWTARSINGMLGLMCGILEDNLKQGHVVRNVGKLVDRLPAEKQEMKTLSEADMFKILDYPDRDRHLWTLALYGLRRGEIAALKWENVDLDKKTVTISENRVSIGKQIVTGTPKSARSRRVLPLPDDVLDVLRDAQQRIESEYVAAYPDGKPYTPSMLSHRWEWLLAKLGIEYCRLHDARHTCGTLMHLRGVPIAVIAAWLGHASASFTLSTYVHSQEDALIAASGVFKR
ncbi:site-specific integrase [Mycolicibacterium moriokaense]|nr:site-specific integrase [Mycolicibacterium moriokaense]